MSRTQMIGWALVTGLIVLIAAAFASGFIGVKLEMSPVLPVGTHP